MLPSASHYLLKVNCYKVTFARLLEEFIGFIGLCLGANKISSLNTETIDR